jgi:hypothetical protein
MNLSSLFIDKQTKKSVVDFLVVMNKEIEGINMALRDMCEKKDKENEILRMILKNMLERG